MELITARSRAFIGHPQATELRVKIPCVHVTWRDLRAWWQMRYYPACMEYREGPGSWKVDWPETWAWLRNQSYVEAGRIVFGAQMQVLTEDEMPEGLPDKMRAAMIVARLNNKI